MRTLAILLVFSGIACGLLWLGARRLAGTMLVMRACSERLVGQSSDALLQMNSAELLVVDATFLGFGLDASRDPLPGKLSFGYPPGPEVWRRAQIRDTGDLSLVTCDVVLDSSGHVDYVDLLTGRVNQRPGLK